MKRIEFVAPVESMRGNLSGNQILEYAENNNPAFDAPAGVQYARNYQPRFIGAKRSATGKKYFQIKTKSATKINAGSKLKMALLGGTGAVRAAILSDATKRAVVEAVYAAAKEQGRTSAKTLQKYVYDVVYEGLQSKSVMIQFFATGVPTLTIQNPWVYTNQQGGVSITIKEYILVKFWPQLATDPIVFTVDGLKGVAHGAETFKGIETRGYNVLGFVVTEDNNVKIGDQFICFKQTGVDYGALAVRDIRENGAPDVATLDYYLNENSLAPWSD